MGGKKNGGNFFNPDNVLKTIINPIVAPIDYGVKAVKRNMAPPDIPQVSAPTSMNQPPPTPNSQEASNSPEMVAQRKNRLAALRLGFASTVANMYGQKGLGSGPAAKTTLGS